MRKGASVLVFAALLLIAGVTEAPAVAFNTVGGIGNCLVNTCAGGFVEIDPHPSWTPNIGLPGVGPVWISYTDSGFGGSVVPNSPAPPFTSATATETFQMLIPAGFSSLSLLIWADDTAGVRLDNGAAYLLAPNPSQGSVCADGGVTCTGAGSALVIALDHTVAHTVEFDTFQRELDTFGLMVQGELTPVPEPATLLLVGSTLAAVGVISRRRLQKKQQELS
jgi:hypothetical protein